MEEFVCLDTAYGFLCAHSVSVAFADVIMASAVKSATTAQIRVGQLLDAATSVAGDTEIPMVTVRAPDPSTQVSDLVCLRRISRFLPIPFGSPLTMATSFLRFLPTLSLIPRLLVTRSRIKHFSGLSLLPNVYHQCRL